jgi:hypothetical protein
VTANPAAAATTSLLISREYREMQEKLHENPEYGVASVYYAPVVADIARSTGATELLDYGAGKGRLGPTLREKFGLHLEVHHYDPAIPAWSATPQPCRLVACIDVLEHIEPDLLDNVLEDLKRVVSDVGIFTVHTGAALKSLPDGRNAHLIQRPVSWWLPKFMERFELAAFNRISNGFWVAVERAESLPRASGN